MRHDATSAIVRDAIQQAKRRLQFASALGYGFAQVVADETADGRLPKIPSSALLYGVDLPDVAIYGYGYVRTGEVAKQLSANGWLVRSLNAPPSSTFLIADDVAVMEPKSLGSSPEYVQVFRDTPVVESLRQHFERAWSFSVDILFEDLLKSSSPESAGRIATIAEDTWSSLIAVLAKNPTLLQTLSPRKFEELVAELLARDGFSVQLTPKSKDGGRDILAYLTSATGNHLFYVECKQRRRSPIGVEVVRALYGTVSKDRATAGLLVTTSTFTKGALQFAREIEHQISLKDKLALVKWLENQGAG